MFLPTTNAAMRSCGCALLIAAASVILLTGPVRAQQCGEPYEVQSGDNLYNLAQAVYGDEKKWPLIFYPNKDKIGSSPSFLRPKTELYIPCLARDHSIDETRTPGEPPARGDVELRFLTADDYEPFSHRGLPGHGMVPTIVRESMDLLPDAPTYGIFWVNKWAVHLDPLLSSTAFDMGFPWLKPDCTQKQALSEADAYRCDEFLFSEPLTEFFIHFYVRHDSTFKFTDDSDLAGKTLCRPEGYYTFDLDQYGRNWLANGTLNLAQPATPKECFQMLIDGKVDFVSVNNYTGHKVIETNGWSNVIRTAHEPFSRETLHVLISKSHPRARQYLALINEGIEELTETKRLSEIAYGFAANEMVSDDQPDDRMSDQTEFD